MQFTSGATELAAMASGDIDIGYLGVGAHVFAPQGQCTILALDSTDLSGEILVNADSGYKTMADLKGKNVAISAGTTSELVLSMALKLNGMERSDVNMINMDASGKVTAFMTGQIDSISIEAPYTDQIRKEMGEDVPIIILTAYDWSDIEEEANEAGVTAFCSKPLFLSELRSCLYSIVHADEEKKEAEGIALNNITGRILLAEDNILNQEIAVEILTSAGFEVEVAENGQIAVDKLEGSKPGYYQLVLMDIQMPVMNGYEAVKRIRRLADKELSSVPVFAMTANAFEEDKREALKCGMNGHIAKPINIRELLDTLGRALT